MTAPAVGASSGGIVGTLKQGDALLREDYGRGSGRRKKKGKGKKKKHSMPSAIRQAISKGVSY